MKKITRQQLVELLKANKSATFGSFMVSKEHKLKKSSPFSEVRKFQQVQANLNNNYQNKVRKEDPDFEVGERKWGTAITNSLIEHKGKYYCQILNAKHGQPAFMADGQIVDPENLAAHEYAKSKSDSPVKVACYKIDDIIYANILGETYEIVE